MEVIKSFNVTDHISQIQAGENLSKAALETGISISSYDELLVQQRIDNLTARRAEFKMHGKYTLHADDTEHKDFAYAMLSDMNRIWFTLNRRPKVSEVDQYGNFKTEDIRMIFPRVSYLIYLTRYARLKHDATFLQDPEVKTQYNIFRQNKVLINPVKNTDEKKLILIEQLQQLQKKLGRAPMKFDTYGNGGIYMQCYRAFGSFKTALQEAGIKSAGEVSKEVTFAHNERKKAVKAALIEQLKNLQKDLGREPLPHEIEPGVPYEKTKLANYYPDFAAACRKAGILESYSYAGKFYTQNQMLDMLKNLTAVLGHTPSHKDVNLHLPLNSMAFFRHFGSLGKALLQAGVIDKSAYAQDYMSFAQRKKAKKQLQDVQ